jgi:hypothetical protein
LDRKPVGIDWKCKLAGIRLEFFRGTGNKNFSPKVDFDEVLIIIIFLTKFWLALAGKKQVFI